MGLPIVQEIWDGIRWIITFIFDKAPKPIKLVIFLLFLLFFGAVITAVLHITGIHCDSSKEVQKIDTLDISTNVKIYWWDIKDTALTPVLDINEALPYNFLSFDDPASACVYYMKNNSGEFEICTNSSDVGCKFYFKASSCHNCTPVDVGRVYAPDTFLNWINLKPVCGDNATRLTSQNWIKSIILCDSACKIPPHYQWDIDLGRFECYELEYCGLNATFTPDSRIDQELDDSNAEPLYKDKNAKGISNVILIKYLNAILRNFIIFDTSCLFYFNPGG